MSVSLNIEYIDDALALCRKSFVAAAVFSFGINILMLTPIFYMINVFDKAVATGSTSTLLSLIVIAIFLYVVMGLLEWTRSRVMIHIGSRLDKLLAGRLYTLCFEAHSGQVSIGNIGSQPLSDLNGLRQFLSGSLVVALFDLPWIPLFLLIMLFFHPVLAAVAVVCMLVMGAIAVANQRGTTNGLQDANRAASKIALATQKNLRNAEAAWAMGMLKPLMSRWRASQDEMLKIQSDTSEVASGYGALIKVLGVAIQSAAITTGAMLAMAQEISPGVIIGAALLLGKTLQPIQVAVGGWKGMVDAREQYIRLDSLLKTFPLPEDKMPLPPIKGHITAKNVEVTPPGGEEPTLTGVNFNLQPGTVTMILGPSAAGKSTLLRAILGLWPTSRGEMRIDGAEADSYDRSEIGSRIGYLPQDIELFDGSVAENIARFGELDSEAVVQAARDAGVHEMILALPEGYNTVISGQQGLISPGQRQRIALARAVYGRPSLVLLDEPNSNLDESGEQALNEAILALKNAGCTVVLVSHRQGALPLVDYLIFVRDGRISDQGTKAEIVERTKLQQQKQMQQQQEAQVAKAANANETAGVTDV
jgi:ATP-binding cassette subfamily C protein EexD